MDELLNNSIDLLSAVGLQLNKTRSVPWHLLKIIDDLLGTKILVLQDSFSKVVAKEDQLNSIDCGNMAVIDNEVVYGLASHLLPLSNISWVYPLTLKPNGVSWGNLETTLEEAHFSHAIHCRSFDNTLDGCWETIR